MKSWSSNCEKKMNWSRRWPLKNSILKNNTKHRKRHILKNKKSCLCISQKYLKWNSIKCQNPFSMKLKCWNQISSTLSSEFYFSRKKLITFNILYAQQSWKKKEIINSRNNVKILQNKNSFYRQKLKYYFYYSASLVRKNVVHWEGKI